ncbi:RNA polymerase sigma-70 factor [Flavivirga aquimarina]|uniref:RNA polymerase sigma-70 factor n=1 Tax=Flavivirga aquimarina TaxID=2027862 RepID=A0ABT8W573_9FLAO|nr:RNA polymerase sigma-70 factor [Flavivirga aquimarina]MDO5968253.1 RNA polymerase sigma-70 factor [Flavivirga aquimarina]
MYLCEKLLLQLSHLKSNKNTIPIFDIKTPEGFEKTYKMFSKKMYSICYSKVNDKEISRDIVQNIFKSLWERKDSIEINSSMEHYLIKAVKFKVIDYYRAKASKKDHLIYAYEENTSFDNTTDNDVSFNELQDKIDAVVDKLPKQCKNVYKLSREKGVSNKEIATSLFISERAVAYHISKAVSSLKNELVEYY